jgi:aminoglycoside 6'-N-acetyltransferase I
MAIEIKLLAPGDDAILQHVAPGVFDDPIHLWINDVSVAAYHRRGLATRLLRRLFEQARTLGCAEAWVLTDRSNPAAMRLYAAAGASDPPADAVMFTFRLGGAAELSESTMATIDAK